MKLPSRVHGVRAGYLALFLGVSAASLFYFLYCLHFTVNITPSMPIGVYRVFPIDRPIARGDVVEICPSPELARAILKRKANMQRGFCVGQTVPLLKFVAAVAGDVVDLRDDAVRVNGVALPGSATLPPEKGKPPVPRMARGRYVLGFGQLWLWTPYSRSWDSRYFGPLPAANAQGFAQPVLTNGYWADWAGGRHRLAVIPPSGKKN